MSKENKNKKKATKASKSIPSGSQTDPYKPKPTNKGQKADNPVRIYADGVFDLFHFGHARALEQAKLLFPHVHLMVGVCNDEITHAYKGKTVMTDDERYESVRHCKWVDEVIFDAPWVVTPEFLEQHNIDYVAHDALPYADASGQADDCYGPVKRLGKFMATQRTDGVSTSDLILRIIKDYHEYVLRNLSRGYSRKDLNVSLLREQRIKAGAQMRRISQRVKDRRIKVGHAFKNARALRLPSSILPKDVEKGVKELAQGVESLVDKVVSGQLGLEMVDNMDKLITGFIGGFERRYSKLERVIKELAQGINKKKKGGGGGGGGGGKALAVKNGGVTKRRK